MIQHKFFEYLLLQVKTYAGLPFFSGSRVCYSFILEGFK